MCTNCAIGSKKKKFKGVGSFNEAMLKEKGIEALEVITGAGAGAILSLEVIRMVPAAKLNSDLRDGLGVATGLTVALVAPAEYRIVGIALGATIAGVFGMNAYMRHFAAPGIGKNKRKPFVGAPANGPVLAGAPANGPVVGNVDTSNKVFQMMKMQMAA